MQCNVLRFKRFLLLLMFLHLGQLDSLRANCDDIHFLHQPLDLEHISDSWVDASDYGHLLPSKAISNLYRCQWGSHNCKPLRCWLHHYCALELYKGLFELRCLRSLVNVAMHEGLPIVSRQSTDRSLALELHGHKPWRNGLIQQVHAYRWDMRRHSLDLHQYDDQIWWHSSYSKHSYDWVGPHNACLLAEVLYYLKQVRLCGWRTSHSDDFGNNLELLLLGLRYLLVLFCGKRMQPCNLHSKQSWWLRPNLYRRPRVDSSWLRDEVTLNNYQVRHLLRCKCRALHLDRCQLRWRLGRQRICWSADIRDNRGYGLGIQEWFDQ